MTWIVVGVVLTVVGALLAAAAARGAASAERRPARGLVMGTGLGLVGWGLIALVVGLVQSL